MSRHATDHREQDDVSQWDSAQALDGDDNLLAERVASRAVLAFLATAAAALICAAAIIWD